MARIKVHVTIAIEGEVGTKQRASLFTESVEVSGGNPFWHAELVHLATLELAEKVESHVIASYGDHRKEDHS